MRWNRRSRLLAVGAVALAAAVGIGAVVVARTPLSGPDAPYQHPGFAESSVATEDVGGGQARVVVDGLRGLSYWCIAPRRNEFAVQIACRPPASGSPAVSDPTAASTGYGPVDLVADHTGQVLFADVDLRSGRGATGLRTGEPDPVGEMLDATFLRLWPAERAAVEELFDQARPSRAFVLDPDPIAPADPDDQYQTQERRTDTAGWSLWSRYTGEPLALRIRTDALQDRTWPFGGEHYATALSTAVEHLTDNGFDCATSCYRSAEDQSVLLDANGDQIVSASFTLRTISDDNRADDSAGTWVRSGLSFLTPAVHDAVADRIEQQRLAHQSWRGVVAGTPLQITAHDGASVKDEQAARDLDVMIGIPLLAVT